MKKLLFIMAIQMVIFSSCDKQEVTSLSKEKTEKDKIVSNAIKLSEDHDSLLMKLLLKKKQLIRQKVKGQTMSTGLEIVEIFNVVEAVTGVRPYIAESSGKVKQMTLSNTKSEEFPVFNFDERSINLAAYTNSATTGKYLEDIDALLQDSLLDVSEKIVRIKSIQEKVKSDPLIDKNEFENFFNTTEVLKGSMIIWSNQNNEISDKNEICPIYKAKPIKQWSFFAKLAFVAAADAVGAVLGTFVGGFLVVNGVPIYIPSGPQGACVGLATLSLIAGNMVGW